MIFFVNATNYPSNNYSTVMGALKIDESMFPVMEEKINSVIAEVGKNPYIIAKWNKISPAYIPLYKAITDVFFDNNASYCASINENCNDLTTLAQNIGDMILSQKDDSQINIFINESTLGLEAVLKDYLLSQKFANFSSATILLRESRCMQMSEVFTGLIYYSINNDLYAAKIGQKGKPELVNYFLTKPKDNNKISIIQSNI